MRRAIARVPSVVLVAAYVVLGGHPVLGGALGAFVLLPSFVRRSPANVPTFAAVAVAAICAGVALFDVQSTNLLGQSAPRPLHEALSLAAIGAIAVRSRFADASGGEAQSLGFALVGVMGLGAAEPAALYGGLVAVFVASGLVALRALDLHRPSLASLSVRHRTLTAVTAVLAVVFSLGLARALPPLHDRVQSEAVRLIGGGSNRAGFGGSISLGELTSILDSDRVALRVYGEHVDHLRGVVYTRYSNGRWYPGARLRGAPRAVDEGASASAVVEHVEADDARWFVPLDADVVEAPGGIVHVDANGIFRPEGAATRIGLASAPPRALAPPDDDDLAVPERLREELRTIAEAWTVESATTSDRLVAIRRALASFTYSLEIPSRRRGRDPILAFLTEHRTGHCEYFASAMTLLSRTLGIPTRVVGGYLVVERNPLADHWTVRDRNAHAWVEAWVDGRWQTYDPTPPSGLAAHMPKQASQWQQLEDAARAKASAALAYVVANLAWLAPLALVAALLFLFRRELRAWRRPSSAATGSDALTYEDPAAAFRALEDQLERRGVRRLPHETLEAFAERLALDPATRPAAPLVLRYAAARYRGDPVAPELDRRLRSDLA